MIGCFCCSGKAYQVCCGLYHMGDSTPATAEALMRSRYSAFVTKDEAYLLATWAAKTRPHVLDLSGDQTDWQKLEIINTRLGLGADNEGWVEFKAHFRIGAKHQQMQERSYFQKTAEGWRYVDGIVQFLSLSTVEKPSKNALCSCGSGKKFKCCCGRL